MSGDAVTAVVVGAAAAAGPGAVAALVAALAVALATAAVLTPLWCVVVLPRRTATALRARYRGTHHHPKPDTRRHP